MATHNPDIIDEHKSLRRPLRLTLAAMWLERLLAAFWPALSLLAVGFAAVMFGGVPAIPAEFRWWFIAVFAVVALVFLLGGLWRFARPRRADALARMDARVAGQPIAALQDRLVLGHGDETSRAIWRAHVARMVSALGQVRAVGPKLALRHRDPFALRLVALVAFVMALGFGSIDRVAESYDAVTAGDIELATGPSWEGWVEPPGYTGKPPLYLADLQANEIAVPVGSRVTVRFYGEPGELTLAETISGQSVEAADDPNQVFELRQSGTVTISGAGGRSWEFTALADAVPNIAPEGILETRLSGEWSQPFLAGDDYGVTSGFARIALDLPNVERRYGLAPEPEPRADIELELPFPFTRDRREIEGVLEEYLVRHPWAGLPVSLTFGANDAAMQVGLSEPEFMVLPARRFFDPLSAGLIEMRRDLLWTRENAKRIAQVLRAMAYDPKGDFRSETDRERVRALIRRLETLSGLDRLTPELQEELADILWDLAVAIEEGNLSDALERLRRAEDRLEQAMRDGASPEEIEQLMQEFREALNDYIRQLAEQNRQDGEQQQSQQGDQQRMEMNSDQLQQLLDRLQELMEQGRMAEAQELMEMLRQMLENMEVQQGQGGEQGQGQQAMEGLSDTLRDQERLSDDTFGDLQNEGQGQSGQQGRQNVPGGRGEQGDQGQDQPGGSGENLGEGEGEGDRGGPGGGDLAGRQEALRQQLEDQLNNLPGQAGEDVRRSLDEAGRAMDGAEDALRRGDLGEALEDQADAMDALREGMQSLAEELARNQEGQQGQAQGRGGSPERADPLGREAGNQGQANTDENMLQGQDVYRRAEELLNELRRRSGERDRSAEELDYLGRLLERF